MLTRPMADSGFAVDDVEQRHAACYGEHARAQDVRGVTALLWPHLAATATRSPAPMPGHTPADYTILNFPVDDIEAAVGVLTARVGCRSGATTGRRRTSGGLMREDGS